VAGTFLGVQSFPVLLHAHFFQPEYIPTMGRISVVDPEDLIVIARYLQAHNGGVETGKWSALAFQFDEEGILRFDGIEMGPFNSREAIQHAFEVHPPDDLLVIDQSWIEQNGDLVIAGYSWAKHPDKPAGTLRFRIQDEQIQELVVVFEK
jgi:hypothetical protein